MRSKTGVECCWLITIQRGKKDRETINHRDTAGRHINRDTGTTVQANRQAGRQSYRQIKCSNEACSPHMTSTNI